MPQDHSHVFGAFSHYADCNADLTNEIPLRIPINPITVGNTTGTKATTSSKTPLSIAEVTPNELVAAVVKNIKLTPFQIKIFRKIIVPK